MYGPALISLLVFATVVLLSVAGTMFFQSREERQRIVAKIRDDQTKPQAKSAEPEPEDRGFKSEILRFTQKVGKKIQPEDQEAISNLQGLFMQAGLRGKNSVVLFFGTKVIFSVFLLACFLVIRLFIYPDMGFMPTATVAILVTGAGFYVPNFWLSIMVRRRREKMIVGFPDALDLLVICAEAGMGLDSALRRVGEEIRLSNRAVSDEFRMLNLELRAGKSRRDALRNLGIRTGLEDVNSLVTLLIQTDKFGTSVAQALRVHADSMRTKRAQRVEEIAAKLPVKLLFPTLFCIFPSLFLVIMGPALIQILRIWRS
jgi:tight adherence protein C